MATLTAAQIKAIGDAATKAAGGDTRAGAAAAARAQQQAAKATSAQSVYNNAMKTIQSGSSGSKVSSGSSSKASNSSSPNTSTPTVNQSRYNPASSSSSSSSSSTPTVNQSRYNPATASAPEPNYVLTAGQIKAIGDAATRAAGGDARAGTAAVTWAQNQAAKAESAEEVAVIWQVASGYMDAEDFDQAIYQVRYGTPVGSYSPSWDAIFNYRDTLNEHSYAQQNAYADFPKVSDYEYHSRYLPPSTVVKAESPSVGAGLGGYTIPKNNSSPTPTPEQSRYNPLAPVPSTPATPGQHDANIKDTSAAATTAKDRVGAIGSGGSGSTGGSSNYTKWLESLDWRNSGSGGGSYGGGSGSSGSGAASGLTNEAHQLILGLPVEAQRAALSDIQSLADLYGIDYNRDNIESVFKDATNAAHEANLKEYDRTARQYYDKLGATQNSLIDTLRKQRAASIASGANAGMQNATELSEILGLTQTVSPDALALAQDRNALIEAYNAQLAQDVRDAMEYSDQLKQALAALASEKYGYDAQQYVAELSHNANVQAQNTASSAAYTGNKYATLEDILGLAVVPSLTYTKKG